MSTLTLPLSFNALVIDKPGAQLRAQRKSVASLNDGEALIRVAYASINRMDPSLAQNNFFNLPLPYVLGFDYSGEVVMLTGSSKGGLKVGQQVFGKTLAGGCFAEYVVAQREDVHARGAVPAPEASTFGIAYLTAYESLVLVANIERHKGKWIYIAGAAGGVGHFAAQIAKLYGLKVIGSAGKAASVDLLHKLGLNHVIDYAKADVVQEIMKLTGGRGADLVYDSTYTQSSYRVSAAAVAAGGLYVRLGTAASLARSGAEDVTSVVEGRGAKMLIGDLGRYRVDPQYRAQTSKLSDGLRQAVLWYAERLVQPVITATVPLEAAALEQTFATFSKSVSNVGKVVIKCN